MIIILPVIKTAILITLLYISIRDIKERIIPDWAVLIVLILSTTYFFLGKGSINDYLFYIFLSGMPLLIISFVIESLSSMNKYITDYFILIFSAIIAFVVPFDYKTKYIIACSLILVLTFILSLIKKKDNDENAESGSIGGGDIKLIAALGPIIQLNILGFLFITFLLSYIFMKFKKLNYIYLAPFMFVGFAVLLFVI